MTTMNISLPGALKEFIDTQVEMRGYSTSSEYVRELIRLDQTRQGEQRLSALMAEGLESGAARLADKKYWNGKRTALRKKHSPK